MSKERPSDKGMITWEKNDAKARAEAMAKYATVYDGVEPYHQRSTANSYYRNFMDIETNRSVRSPYGTQDYLAFRPGEQVPTQQKRIIKMCMEAYNKVGIIRNIIDLMGDFGCQGINIAHENESVEKFYQQWFKKVNGKERSERFLNNLYRTGNVPIYRSMAKLTPETKTFLKSMAGQAHANDIVVEIPTIENSVIPWRYTFFNPLSVDIKDGLMNLFLGQKKFEIDSTPFVDNFKDGVPADIMNVLPPDIKSAIKSGAKRIPLDPERLSMVYYKKDDWDTWAYPMLYAILDDVVMLEKMRLADSSALDGAISNIRLWTLGTFETPVPILPNRAVINKLRNILASNVGGGTMDLVWGPELKFTESNSQVYKFLGSEKYQAVLNGIYAGLGVPPTLTGLSGNGGGLTNNAISLKTLIQRLQYGRDLLNKFWEHEIEIVRKAMGFRKSAHMIYDNLNKGDEATEKQLLIQLADRNIISDETVLERFNELGPVERVRMQREMKLRKEDKLPEKVSPFIKPESQIPGLGFDPPMKSANPQGGRPLAKKDGGPRKKRVDTPRKVKGAASLFVWTQETYSTISELLNKGYLESLGKSNLRQLTKEEVCNIEEVKLHALVSLAPLDEVSPETIYAALEQDLDDGSSCFLAWLKEEKIDTLSLNFDDYKKRVVASYAEFLLANFDIS